MAIHRNYVWAAAALLGAGLATAVSAQGYGDMMKGAAKDAAKEAVGGMLGTPTAGAAATPSAGPAATPSEGPAATPSAGPAATPSAGPVATPSAAGAAAPADPMDRVNSAAGAGAGAAAAGAMGGNVKGAAMDGTKAGMDDWKKTGAAPAAAAPAADAPAADEAGDAEE